MREPLRGENLLKFLNELTYKNDVLTKSMPILADVFVFTYPVYLLALYFYGIGKKDNYYKEAAMLLFFSGFGSIFVNILIQVFVTKARPDVVLDLFLETRESLLLTHLPQDTFPSDHAAMAAAIATTTLLRGIKRKDKTFVYFGFVLIAFAVIMGIARIATGIHWPTDILAGTLVGILFSIFMLQKDVFLFVKKHIFKRIIEFQERVWEKIFGVRR